MKKSIKILIVIAIIIILCAEGVIIFFQFFNKSDTDNNKQSDKHIVEVDANVYEFNIDDTFYTYNTNDSDETKEAVRVRIYGEFVNADADTFERNKLYCHIDGYDMEGYQVNMAYSFGDKINIPIDEKFVVCITACRRENEENSIELYNEPLSYMIAVDVNLEDIVIIINNNEDNSTVYLCNKK